MKKLPHCGLKWKNDTGNKKSTFKCLIQSRGVLTLTWYTYYMPAFWGAFSQILYSNQGGGFHHRWRHPIYINWLYFEQMMAKSTQL